MAWTVEFHDEVSEDLAQLGRAEAQRVLKVVRERMAEGEPDKLGKPLRGVLAGYRRMRTGDIRIVYRVEGTQIVVILCVGARRDDEVYDTAAGRV